jgi:hypothetical protein
MGDLFSISQKYREQYPGVGFGLTLITGCRDASNPPGFDHYKRKLLRKMRKRETLAQITERIEIYTRFFQLGCLLTKQKVYQFHQIRPPKIFDRKYN